MVFILGSSLEFIQADILIWNRWKMIRRTI